MLVIVSGSWERADGDTLFGLLLHETHLLVWLMQKQTTKKCYHRELRLYPP